MDSALSKKPIFGDQDDGLVSIADVATKPMYHSVFQSRGSLRSFSLSSSSSVSIRCFDEQLTRQPHFLENCFLCKKHIGGNNDIYMYRGDTPFCSEECRQEQIETDEAKENEKKWAKSMRKNQKKSNSSSSNNKSQGYPFRTGTVAAA